MIERWPERNGQVPATAALESLYDRYATVVFSLAFRVTGDRSLAEEILGEVFVRASLRVQGLPAEGDMALVWLIDVTRAVAIETADASDAVRPAPPAPTSTAEAVEEIEAKRQAVNVALDALSSEQRQAVELAYFAGMTTREIAASLDASPATVNRWLREAVRVLGEATKGLRRRGGIPTNRIAW